MRYQLGRHNRRDRATRALRMLKRGPSSAVAAGLIMISAAALVGHTSGLVSMKGPVAREDHVKLSAANQPADAGTSGSAAGKTAATPNKRIFKAANTATTSQPVLRNVSCASGTPMRQGLDRSTLSQLRKLAQHEAVCGSAVMERISFFVGTPATTQQAKDEAAWVADVLKELSKYGLGALVFMEPSAQGQVLDSKQYRAGAYDAPLDTYYATLKAKGVTDAMMGMWVPFPEANIPVWSSTDPADYVANVTRTAQIQKKYFPGSRVSLLLDSKSYPSSGSWEGGSYKSFLPYVATIPKGLIDAFGLQGFAWPPQYGEPAQLDPKVFLPVNLASEAASAMGVSDVWLNTGSYGRAARQDKAKPNVLTQVQRQVIMDGIIAQAKVLQNRGYKTTIHLFAEDKFATDEAIDWSYWDPGQSDADSFKPVYRTFVSDARKSGIGLWLYDSL